MKTLDLNEPRELILSGTDFAKNTWDQRFELHLLTDTLIVVDLEQVVSHKFPLPSLHVHPQHNCRKSSMLIFLQITIFFFLEFKLVCNETTFFVRANNEEQMRMWVNAISDAVNNFAIPTLKGEIYSNLCFYPLTETYCS